MVKPTLPGAGASLTGRLIWLAAAWSLMALAITGAVLTTAFREAALSRLGGVLETTIDEVVAATNVVAGEVVTPQIQDARTLRVYSGKYWAVAEAGPDGELRPLRRSESLWDADLARPPQGLEAILAVPGQPVFYDTVGPQQEPLRAVATVRTLPNRDAPLIFLAAIDRSLIDQDSARFALLTWSALGLLGVGLVGAVFVQVRFGLRPLYDLGREIRDVRRGRSQRLSRRYPTEIAPLADELNALLDHNQEVVDRQRTHVGNLAHALKTPLAVMLAEAEARPVEGRLAETVRRQAAVMRAQVDHHLQRARAAARAQTAGQRTPVEDVVDELASLLERVFRSKEVVIDWRVADGLCFRGERQDLQEILGNVLENACKWCERRVRVVAAPAGEGRLALVVEDDGAGLPADQREDALKRGARLDESEPGTGLGLSIVDELVRAYGGRLSLGDAAAGGLRVEIELPAVEA